MNGRVPPFENGPDRDAQRSKSATVVDMTYDEPTGRTHTASLGGGPAHTGRVGSPALIPVEWEDESDTQVKGARHLAASTGGASLELDWDNDDSNTEKWLPKHVRSAQAPARAVRPAPPPRQTPSQLRPSDDVIEELREQLIDVLERARISESRAVSLERGLQEAEKAKTALVTLRSQFSLAIERARESEAQRAAAERRAQEGEEETEAALERLSQQLVEALQRAETIAERANDAELSSRRVEQALQQARAERHMLEENSARALRRARARSVVVSLLAFGLLIACAALGYFVAYMPLQGRLLAEQQLNASATARQSQALADLQARQAAERAQFDAERRQFDTQLSAARTGGPSSAPPAGAVPAPAGTVRAAASAGRWHRAKAAAADKASAEPADSAASPASPAAQSRAHAANNAAAGDSDPLGGL
jgi:hypothetical protein